MADVPQDPMEFLKSMWSSMGFPLPGMVTPTLDVSELEKRIADLKAVEGWLKMNLNMLQTSIQGLEVQRNTLSVLQGMREAQNAGEAAPNPFANPANWPWNFAQPAAGAAGQKAPASKKK